MAHVFERDLHLAMPGMIISVGVPGPIDDQKNDGRRVLPAGSCDVYINSTLTSGTGLLDLGRTR